MSEIFQDEIIDKEIPFHGPCGFCGHQDARHRLFDNIIDSTEDKHTLSEWHKHPINIIHRIIELKPYQEKAI